jgi:hypothetical protein
MKLKKNDKNNNQKIKIKFDTKEIWQSTLALRESPDGN